MLVVCKISKYNLEAYGIYRYKKHLRDDSLTVSLNNNNLVNTRVIFRGTNWYWSATVLFFVIRSTNLLSISSQGRFFYFLVMETRSFLFLLAICNIYW